MTTQANKQVFSRQSMQGAMVVEFKIKRGSQVIAA
jgi:hypothetical protein